MMRPVARISLVATRTIWTNGRQKNRILLPDSEIHPLLEVRFLLNNKLVVRDNIVGLHEEFLQVASSSAALVVRSG